MEKYTWGKKAGGVEMGREREVLWKDCPGHCARSWVQKPDGEGDGEEWSTRAGQNGRLKHCASHHVR